MRCLDIAMRNPAGLNLVATVSTHAGNPHFLFKFKRYVHVKVCVYLRSI